jgi:hypothetical protein
VLAVVIVMVLILLLAGGIAAYVAYPHRGEELPVAPWLGDAMNKAADAAPLIEVDYEDSQHLSIDSPR